MKDTIPELCQSVGAVQDTGQVDDTAAAGGGSVEEGLLRAEIERRGVRDSIVSGVDEEKPGPLTSRGGGADRHCRSGVEGRGVGSGTDPQGLDARTSGRVGGIVKGDDRTRGGPCERAGETKSSRLHTMGGIVAGEQGRRAVGRVGPAKEGDVRPDHPVGDAGSRGDDELLGAGGGAEGRGGVGNVPEVERACADPVERTQGQRGEAAGNRAIRVNTDRAAARVVEAVERLAADGGGTAVANEAKSGRAEVDVSGSSKATVRVGGRHRAVVEDEGRSPEEAEVGVAEFDIIGGVGIENAPEHGNDARAEWLDQPGAIGVDGDGAIDGDGSGGVIVDTHRNGATLDVGRSGGSAEVQGVGVIPAENEFGGGSSASQTVGSTTDNERVGT